MVAYYNWSVNSNYSMQQKVLLVIFSLFPWLPICLNFHVFYTFIHLLLGRTIESARPWHRTRLFHRACFVGVMLVACLCFFLNCVLSFGVGDGLAADWPMMMGSLPSAIKFATHIVAWAAATETWVWSIFLAVRHPRCVGGHIVSDPPNQHHLPHLKRKTDHKPAHRSFQHSFSSLQPRFGVPLFSYSPYTKSSAISASERRSHGPATGPLHILD